MISELLQDWLRKHEPFQNGGPYKTNSAESRARKDVMGVLVDELESVLSEQGIMVGNSEVKIEASKGITYDTNCPWIRFYDERTPSATSGWSLVLFASEDANSLSLGIGLGVYKGSKKRETIKYTESLLDDDDYPEQYRVRPYLGTGGQASSYSAATPLSHTWTREELSKTSETDFVGKIEEFLSIFNEVLNKYPPLRPEPRIANLSGKWFIKFNAAMWDFDAFIAGNHSEFSFKIGNFKDIIKEGDPILIWRSGSRAGVVAVGKVKSNPEDRVADDVTSSFYTGEADQHELTTRIQVEVETVFPEVLPKPELLTVLAKNTIVTAPQSTSPFPVSDHEFDSILAIAGLGNGSRGLATRAELADELLVGQNWLDTVISELENKKQIIFQGPPGTGKTYIARAIASHVAHGQALVQFHPSYAYEDFVEGFRPSKHGESFTFDLKPGPLVAIANEARATPEKTFVLVIDEINRGNLAKIFGELYFLLEYRNEEATMQYRTYGETFALPDNLLIIGTMNTADRSISSLDLAIRRRFSFVELSPDSEPINGLLDRWLAREGLSPKIAKILDYTNALIMDSRVKLGPSYFMKPTVEKDLEQIWNFQVLPQLREVFFDNSEVLESLTYSAVTRAAGIDE